MALVGDPIRLGLDVIRIKWGEGAFRFVMRFARSKEINSATSRKLGAVGALSGLNAREIATASSGTTKNTKFPFWLRFILIVAAFIASFIVVIWVRNALYLPGTLYASLGPNDFQKGVHSSSNLSPSMAM